MADNKVIADRIVASAKDELDSEIISKTIDEAMESPAFNRYLESIVANDDYAELYNCIFPAAEFADFYEIKDDNILKRIFRPDTLPDLMLDAVCCAINSCVDYDFIDKSLSVYNQSMESGMGYVNSKIYAGDLLNCGSNGFVNMFSSSDKSNEGNTCLYSREQVSVISDLSDLAFGLAKEKRENFGDSKHTPSAVFLCDSLRDAMEYAGCFDNSLSPEQIKNAGNSVLCSVAETFWDNWKGSFTDEQLDSMKKTDASINTLSDSKGVWGKIEDNRKNIPAYNSLKDIKKQKSERNKSDQIL